MRGYIKSILSINIKYGRKSGLLTGWGNVLERVHLSRPHALLNHQVETLNLSFCYRAFNLLTQCCGCGYKFTVDVLYLRRKIRMRSPERPKYTQRKSLKILHWCRKGIIIKLGFFFLNFIFSVKKMWSAIVQITEHLTNFFMIAVFCTVSCTYMYSLLLLFYW